MMVMRVFPSKHLSLMTAAAVTLSLLLPLQTANGVNRESGYSTLNEATTRQALPIRLKIPKIKVSAPVQYVGLTSSGALGVPRGRAAVAWYNLGPRPGEKGSAVISGHSGSKPGPATVFDNLPKLRKGDVIYVQDSKGKSTTFVVREVRIYSPTADVSTLFDPTGVHLNLVTCIWNPARRAFTKRLVVFTDIKTSVVPSSPTPTPTASPTPTSSPSPSAS